MAIEKKYDQKTKAASIGFRNGLMKDEIVSILHEPGLQELMPEDVRGVLGAELHWAVCYMKKLHDRGRLDAPLPMFETVRSAELIGLETEVENLRDKLFWADLALSHMKSVLDFETVPKYADAASEVRHIKAELERQMREAQEKHIEVVRVTGK